MKMKFCGYWKGKVGTVGVEPKTEQELIAEIEELHCQIKEAKGIIHAIRHGEVDALLISEKKGDQVYILQGADHAYREIIEEMQEGFITLSKDGVILFCNKNFAQMLGNRLEKMIGTSIYELFASPFEAELFQRSLTSSNCFKREFRLKSANGLSISVLVSAKSCIDEQQVTYLIVTDLTEQKRAEQDFMYRVFDQASEAILVCDLTGKIIRSNKVATMLFGADLLQVFFDQAIPLYKEETGKLFLINDASKGNIFGLEVKYTNRSHEELALLISAGILTGQLPGEALGFLVTIADITLRKRAEEELARVNLIVEDTLKAKSRFLANMSHELRTPLNAIIGFSEVLQDKLFGPLNAKQETFITNIVSSGRHLLSLINDVLDISKMEANKMSLELSSLNIEEVCQETIAAFSEKARKKQIELSCTIDPSMSGVPVVADVRKIKQILYNLVDNGIKFNRASGTVSILIQKVSDAFEAEAVQIVVEDTGIGITKADQAKLFVPFSQLAQSCFDKQTEGTGLGLALSKHLVELHGGTILIRSELGKGCRFTVLLPLRSL
jgi:PAS domain S-box-containing protein